MSVTSAVLLGGGSERSFRAALARLDAAQKPGAGVPAYTRWVNRRGARAFAAAAYRAGIGPNAVSVSGFVLSIAGIGLLLTLRDRPALAGICAAVTLALGYVLDSADGQLARLTGVASPRGEWLDHTLDAFRLPLIHLGVLFAVGVSEPLALVAAGFAVLASASFLSQILGAALRSRHDLAPPTPRPGQSWLLLPTDSGVLCWVFVLWAWPTGFALAYGGLFAANLLHTAAAMRRRWADLGQPETASGGVA